MSLGYRITYFGDGDEWRNGVPGLPDHVLCNESLDENLRRISTFLRTWMESDDGGRTPETPFRTFHISVLGPFPEDTCIVDRRTPEERLFDADSPEERFHALEGAAKSSLEADHLDDARKYVLELQEMLPNFKGAWGYEAACATVHIVFGRLALKEGNLEEAKRQLVEAGKSEGSPTMSSFGPNMSLAQDLLMVGEKQAVLDYFQACRSFWERGADQLDEWAIYVKADWIPDFGANLVY